MRREGGKMSRSLGGEKWQGGFWRQIEVLLKETDHPKTVVQPVGKLEPRKEQFR